MSLTIAARRELVATPPLVALLGSSPTYAQWIFRWRLYEQVEGTGTAAIVLSEHPWEPPGNFHTRRHIRLQAEIYVDPTRQPDLNPTQQNVHDRVLDIAAELSKVCHRPQGGTIYFDTMRIHGIERLGEPSISDIPMMDYTVRGLVNFGALVD